MVLNAKLIGMCAYIYSYLYYSKIFKPSESKKQVHLQYSAPDYIVTTSMTIIFI